MNTESGMNAAAAAAATYIARRDRKAHPEGSFDRAGRWYPSEREECACCEAIRSPSRAHPYSLMAHCRTLQHIANLYGVPAADVRKAVREIEGPARREGGDHYYKSVALVDGRLLSIYDGMTEYKIGVEMRQAARQGHGGGYYVYPSLAEAARAAVPRGSALRDAPRVIIRVRAGGSYCRYGEGKLSFSRITPLEIVQPERALT